MVKKRFCFQIISGLPQFLFFLIFFFLSFVLLFCFFEKKKLFVGIGIGSVAVQRICITVLCKYKDKRDSILIIQSSRASYICGSDF